MPIGFLSSMWPAQRKNPPPFEKWSRDLPAKMFGCGLMLVQRIEVRPLFLF